MGALGITNYITPIIESKTINIEGEDYKYKITKDEKENKIIIELSEEKPNKNITFIYKESTEKIVKDIKQLFICENIDEMVISLENMFNKGKISVEKKNEKYLMKIEVTVLGKTSKYEIELEKIEPIDENQKILNKIKEIDDKYKEIKEEINNIKNQNIIYNEEERNKIIKEIKNELNIKEILKELLIKDKDIINILYNEFENKINNNKKEDNNKIEESVNKIIKEKYNNKVDINIYNDNINKIKNDINKQINEINNIKNNFKDKIKNEINEYNKINNKENIIIKRLNEQINILDNKITDNYITLKIEIKKNDIDKDIVIMNQCWIYKLYKSFELEDIEIEINGEHIPIKYKHSNYDSDCTEYKDISKDSESSKKIYSELGDNNYSFFWNFSNEGIYEIKIIFNKKLCSCAGLFYESKNIIQIDLSKFNCSNILSCNSMFYLCCNLKEINLGKLDFALVTDFSYMFYGCKNLVDLDVTNFNTKNSISFLGMFFDCNNLKNIDVSKFNSSKCETIYGMFQGCKNIREIDMINWDMSNLKYSDNYSFKNPIDYLFYSCSNLKKIKISGNFKKEEAKKDFDGGILIGIPESGDLITSKNVECNIPLDGYLPQNWSRTKE